MMQAMATTERISPAMSLGPVELIVGDLEGMANFYEKAIGLTPLARSADGATLGSDDGAPLVELVGDPDAPTRPRRSTGLFHVGVPRAVARSSSRARCAASSTPAGRSPGASDHLVSEALYLDDPEGNGIEIYRDRPRDDWRYENGELQMATLALDLDGVMAELEGDETHRTRARRARASDTCTCRSRTSPRRGRSTTRRSGSTPRPRAIPEPSSCRRAATTTTSARTPGRAPGRPRLPPGSRGLRRYTDRGARRGRARARRALGWRAPGTRRTRRRRRRDGRSVGQPRAPDDRSGDGLVAPALPARGRGRDRRRRGDRHQHRVPPRRGGRARRAAARAGGARIRLDLARGGRRARAVLGRAEHPDRACAASTRSGASASGPAGRSTSTRSATCSR